MKNFGPPFSPGTSPDAACNRYRGQHQDLPMFGGCSLLEVRECAFITDSPSTFLMERLGNPLGYAARAKTRCKLRSRQRGSVLIFTNGIFCSGSACLVAFDVQNQGPSNLAWLRLSSTLINLDQCPDTVPAAESHGGQLLQLLLKPSHCLSHRPTPGCRASPPWQWWASALLRQSLEPGSVEHARPATCGGACVSLARKKRPLPTAKTKVMFRCAMWEIVLFSSPFNM